MTDSPNDQRPTICAVTFDLVDGKLAADVELSCGHRKHYTARALGTEDGEIDTAAIASLDQSFKNREPFPCARCGPPGEGWELDFALQNAARLLAEYQQAERVVAWRRETLLRKRKRARAAA